MEIDDIKDSTILIVDDNPANLGVLFNHLNNYGFNVLISQDGESAIKQVIEEKPNLILLDILMPGIDGFETCRQLKAMKETKDIPIIFMSALSDTVDKVRGFDLGGVDYITKPFQCEEAFARIAAHLTIQNQQKKMYELNKKKDQFFSIISHDLKGPFASLVNLIGYMKESINSLNIKDVQKYIDAIDGSSKKIYALIKNLLDWSRAQLDIIQFEPEWINLNEIIFENIWLYKENTDEKNITVHNLIDSSVSIYADPYMISTVVRNLISNAVKYTNINGEIKILLKKGNDFNEIIITNTGEGIKKENIDKLFQIEIGYRTRGTKGEQGTGLGLVLCKEFVEKHGGKIYVDSELDKITTFRFTLPIYTADSPAS